jgi:hypothetical protein
MDTQTTNRLNKQHGKLLGTLCTTLCSTPFPVLFSLHFAAHNFKSEIKLKETIKLLPPVSENSITVMFLTLSAGCLKHT